jgi:hypothetical protein
MYQNNIRSIELTNNTYNEKNTSITGRTFVADFGNNYWTFRIRTIPLSKNDFAEKFFKTNQVGSGLFYSFNGTNLGRINDDIQIPVLNDSAGTVSGTVSASSGTSSNPSYSQNVGSDTIGVTGGTGTIKAGDLIQFANHNKVYMVTEDCNLDGSSVDVLKITPRLIKNVDNFQIYYNSVTFSAIPDGDVISWKVGLEELYEFEATYREVL